MSGSVGVVASGVDLNVWLEVPVLGSSGLVPVLGARGDSRLECRGPFLRLEVTSRPEDC